ncbi:MAG: acyl-CoA thioesterase [Gammaproteobacteria bacterium]|nr:acyl-CoA thioesterase [Gammaproteobacteria bacterium]
MLTVTQRIRVEWAHCDPAGIIFNPHYYIWMDSGTHALLRAAGFDLVGQTYSDKLFLGCPLVASNMAFSKPLYFGDITVCSSRVESFGNKSFMVAHEFRQGDNLTPVASGNEVRVWGYADADDPAKLLARAMPEEVRAMLSVEKTVNVTV